MSMAALPPWRWRRCSGSGRLFFVDIVKVYEFAQVSMFTNATL
jgi:hypothetical protein